jgi:hypothetical protein
VSTNPRTVCASGTANRAPTRRLQARARAIAVLEQLCGASWKRPRARLALRSRPLATTGARIRIGHARARTANAGWLVPMHAARIVDRPEILEHIHELHDDGLSLQQIADRLEEEAFHGARRQALVVDDGRLGASVSPPALRSVRLVVPEHSQRPSRRRGTAAFTMRERKISTGAFPPAGQRLERRWKVCAR